MRHLTLRVAWHDSRWDGHVCRLPSSNSYCVALDRIREGRDDGYEDRVAGRGFDTLDRLPPCVAESGAFMSPGPWHRTFVHPYHDIPKAAATHGHLQPVTIEVPPYSTFAVPFAWMLRESQERIQDGIAEQLPRDREAPFDSSWVFGRERQDALLGRFFDPVAAGESLAFFYTKEGHPLDDRLPRLVVGVGEVTTVRPVTYYPSAERETYPIWDRLISHSIRPDGSRGFLLPYHDYLEPTGDPKEDRRRQELLAEIVVAPDDDEILTFSYAAEHAGPDVALATLLKVLDAVRNIRLHGIARGEWAAREEWVNEQIAATWRDRGAFPGLGSALEAAGLRLGTSLVYELQAQRRLGVDEDPWHLLDSLIRGDSEPPRPEYQADLAAVRNTWVVMGQKRRRLLQLLSRFDLTPAQAKRWFEMRRRVSATSRSVDDAELLANPYVIAEADLGEPESAPVSLATVDRGAFPDSAIRARHALPADVPVESPMDLRRVRAGIVSALRAGLRSGDTLLSVDETLERLAKLSLSPALDMPSDWMAGNRSEISPVVKLIDVPDSDGSTYVACQLADVFDREDRLSRVLRKRAEASLPSLGVDWREHLMRAIDASGGHVDPTSERHASALAEQAVALERITTRKASVLVGKAGTGKTSTLGALTRCEALSREGILLLAPTGKARVRLARATGAEALTVAQFLYQRGRYDGKRQRPLFEGGDRHRVQRTVVIDEASMLTLDDLMAVVSALDLTHVQRLILVGDPNQLPPIGPGRPFIDFLAHLEQAASGSGDAAINDALGELSTEVRSVAGAPSDALRLASWFTRDVQGPAADRVLSQLAAGETLNDVEVELWETGDELHDLLVAQLERELGLAAPDDVEGFNAALGIDDRGLVPYDDPDGVERFQVLSPVRMRPYGVVEINRWIQRTYRSRELDAARSPWVASLGDERIVVRDKVIQTRNERRKGFDGTSSAEGYLANGEVGIVGPGRHKWLNVHFAHRPGVTFGYRNSTDFPGGSGPLDLAYALTVHKAQGSDFGLVLMVLPGGLPFVKRELIYTALTRSRERLVLLIQGQDTSVLQELGRAERSEAASRNTNMFAPVVRPHRDRIPYAGHLIHTTDSGHLVRSKSELVVANKLQGMHVPYEYEREFRGDRVPGLALPDFTFETPDGSLIIWEHLGLLDKPRYREDWDRKLRWYLENGLEEGQTLFTTREDGGRGLNMPEITAIAERIRHEVV
jgi:AAA domain/UvrD-like helicase C-terminal domain